MTAVAAKGEYRYALQLVSDHRLPVRSFYLEAGEYLVGAADEADLCLPAEGVSRRHARLRILADGGVVITDLGSRNGTFVGSRKVNEAAADGCLELGFGSVRASLSPIDSDGSLLVMGPAPAREQPPGKSSAVAAGSEQTSSLALHLELARSVCRALRASDRGPVAAELGAAEVLKEWLPLLPVSRLELVRTDAGGSEAVVAAAFQDGAPPGSAIEPTAERRDLDLSAGWRLCAWSDTPELLGQLDPLVEAMLRGVLAARPEPREQQETGYREPPADDLPPPGSLCPAIIELYRDAGKIATGEIPVLITGESGSGKEVLARWLHEHSRRSQGPFIAVNCSALPHDLLESELFGIERGVATGVAERSGLFEEAHTGTLFLDEIGDMAVVTQAKILRVLQDKVVYRVGGRTSRQIDVRFLAATNQDLCQAVEQGSFRNDLYQRLAAFVVTIPPLRQRREDVPLLATHFFHQALLAAQRHSPGITRRALAALLSYHWPGNVRELSNEIARAVLLLEPGEPIDLPRLSQALQESVPDEAGAPTFNLHEAVERAEREAIALAWSATGGDARRARELLGIPRTTYYRKLKELGLPTS